tara:strand:+ start:34888 stop:35877 length:990 start_codon:yes stop_codon:yes gene_type:complete
VNILIIGGTEFLGRHLVDAALKAGHSITLFNRQKTNPALFKNIKTQKGDRFELNDFEPLLHEKFDGVIDTCGYLPRNVLDVTRRLHKITKSYVFVSSCSVYDYNDRSAQKFDENGTLVDLNIDADKDLPETYGARKYLCEQAVRSTFVGEHIIVRPGLIVGPHDPTYRFPYWADRLSEGGEVLAPGQADAPLQFIDARDLATWILFALENRLVGTFNTVSPHNELTLGAFLDLAKAEINPSTKLCWVSEAVLREHGVNCWGELPLWVFKEIDGFLKVDSTKAINEGLKFRSISHSIRDTHEWSRTIYQEKYLSKVLSRAKEQKILAALK